MNDIAIDKETLSVLKYIYRRGKLSFDDLKSHFPHKDLLKALNVLVAAKYIWSNSFRDSHHLRNLAKESQLWCTVTGKKYVEDQRAFRWQEIRAWITLAVAIAAFIKSFFF